MDYENLHRKQYEGGETFIPVCPVCSRFVKADKEVFVNGMGELSPSPNATCKAHGRVNMPFEGFVS